MLAAGDGVSRRNVLRGAAAAALAAAVPVGAAGIRPASAAAGRDPKVVIVGSGIAGLGCAFRLWKSAGIRSEVYEYNSARPGGRIHTLRGFFDGGQYTEEHGEFVSSEHTAMRRLAARLGLTLDNVNAYPPHTRPDQYRFRFGGRFWPQAALNREWHEWGFRLFHDAAFRKAPWPTRYDKHTPGPGDGTTPPRRSGSSSTSRAACGATSASCAWPCSSTSTAARSPSSPRSTSSTCSLTTTARPAAASPGDSPQLSGTDEKWHARGGNDQFISRLVARLPAGTVHLGERLEAVRSRGHGRYTCTFSCGAGTRDVTADHVVLALPFTRLREVDLRGLGLPPRQRRAIREEPLGSNSKIQMQFSRRVWNTERWTGNMYTDGIVQGGWEATIDQPGPARDTDRPARRGGRRGHRPPLRPQQL